MRGWVLLEMTLKAGSHAIDQHSVQCTFNLCWALCRLIKEREGQPDLPGGHLISEVVGQPPGTLSVSTVASREFVSHCIHIPSCGVCNLVEVDYDTHVQISIPLVHSELCVAQMNIFGQRWRVLQGLSTIDVLGRSQVTISSVRSWLP